MIGSSYARSDATDVVAADLEARCGSPMNRELMHFYPYYASACIALECSMYAHYHISSRFVQGTFLIYSFFDFVWVRIAIISMR